MHRLPAIGFLVLCPPVLAPVVFAQDAATFRGNAAHTGVYAESGASTFHKIKWEFQTKAQVLSSPVVAAGTVYFGSNDHRLFAVDLATGAKKWEFKTEGRVASTPAIANGLVFFLSYDSNFYALDAASGTLKWKFATAGERRYAAPHIHGLEPAAQIMPDPFDFFLSSPVVSAGLVYFGSGDSNVYALDAATGRLKWKFKTGDVVHSSPAIADGTVFIGSWDAYLYALDATNGAENGDSRPAKITKSTIKSAFRLRQRSTMESCTSDAATQSFMRSKQGPANSSGRTTIKVPGSSIPRQFKAAKCISQPVTPGSCTRWTQKPAPKGSRWNTTIGRCFLRRPSPAI
jgi:glucose dehydrogenase